LPEKEKSTEMAKIIPKAPPKKANNSKKLKFINFNLPP
jgi:hypothetical protein